MPIEKWVSLDGLVILLAEQLGGLARAARGEVQSRKA